MHRVLHPLYDLWAVVTRLPVTERELDAHGAIQLMSVLPLDYDVDGMPLEHTTYLVLFLAGHNPEFHHYMRSQGLERHFQRFCPSNFLQIGSMCQERTWVA